MDSESDFFLPLTAESLLSYEIATFSSFEEPYIPFNITIDQPNNYDSRWTASSLKNEFLILKLTSKALLTSISFGKYKKPFSFNMKDFKVYVEDSSGQFNKVFNGTLRNNTEIEEFSIDYKEHAPIPCYLIKIKAINSWGFNSPVSIWSLKLKGIKDEKVVGFYDRQQKEKTKEIGFEGYMDFLMENHCKGGVDFIKKLGVLKPRKENFIEQLYELLIIKEDYKEVLVLLQDLMTKGIFNDYIAKLPYNFEWKQIIPIKYSSNEEDFDLLMSQQEKFFEPDNFYKKFGTRFKSSKNIPKPRGGHQMIIDEEKDRLYLFGGFFGKKDWDMPDFWTFDIKENKWEKILPRNEEIWPEPRCCHCLAYDSIDKRLYLLGGLVATIETEENEASSLMKSDFFMYDFNLNQWKLISNDTSLEFGPSAISSGQICLDQIRKMLYVFGGRSESASSTPTIYCYKILSDQWTTLDLKEFNSEKAYKDFTSIYENECYGHCMVFNPLNKQLVIYGGIVKGNLISDCFIISTTSLEIKRISFSNNPGPNLPEIAFHKGCYNPKTNSFFFYSGYMKGPKGVYQMNYLFECDIRKNRFRSVYKDFNLDRHYWSQLKQIVPMPRFSHQFLYHSKRDLFYLYGGNPNQPFSVLKERLNDLWSLKVSSPLNETILEETGLWIRKLKVYGMVLKGDLIGVKKELEGLEIKGIWKELLLWGVDEVEKEKLEVFKKIKAMCHCEKIKKRKFCVSYLDY